MSDIQSIVRNAFYDGDITPAAYLLLSACNEDEFTDLRGLGLCADNSIKVHLHFARKRLSYRGISVVGNVSRRAGYKLVRLDSCASLPIEPERVAS